MGPWHVLGLSQRTPATIDSEPLVVEEQIPLRDSVLNVRAEKAELLPAKGT